MTEDGWRAQKTTALLVIHTIFRPLQYSEPLKHDEPLSLFNISGEGQLGECKTCLGWDIQTRSLRLFLPIEKETYGVQDIRAYLASTKINTDNLESLIGKINHATHISPPEIYLIT